MRSLFWFHAVHSRWASVDKSANFHAVNSSSAFFNVGIEFDRIRTLCSCKIPGRKKSKKTRLIIFQFCYLLCLDNHTLQTTAKGKYVCQCSAPLSWCSNAAETFFTPIALVSLGWIKIRKTLLDCCRLGCRCEWWTRVHCAAAELYSAYTHKWTPACSFPHLFLSTCSTSPPSPPPPPLRVPRHIT